jgi:hypothetical protein
MKTMQLFERREKWIVIDVYFLKSKHVLAIVFLFIFFICASYSIAIDDYVLNSNLNIQKNDQRNDFSCHRAFLESDWLIFHSIFEYRILFSSLTTRTREWDCCISEIDETRLDDIICRWSNDCEYHSCFVRKFSAWMIVCEWFDNSTMLSYELSIKSTLFFDEFFKSLI